MFTRVFLCFPCQMRVFNTKYVQYDSLSAFLTSHLSACLYLLKLDM